MEIFFHVGLHKTATTWMQRSFFSEHPDILILNDYMNPWDDELVRELVRPAHDFSADNYRRLVDEKLGNIQFRKDAKIVISAERFSGHPYSGGYDRDVICKRIAQAYPNAKIIVTVRSQTELIASLYQQMVKEGYRGELKDMLSESCWKRPCFSKDFFNYYQLYRLYSDYFAKENIGFFPQELLAAAPEKFVEALCIFMGVENVSSQIDNARINRGSFDKSIRAMRFMNQFRRSDYNLYPLFDVSGKRFKQLVFLAGFFFRNKPEKLKIDEKSAKMLSDRFTKSNARLFEELLVDFEEVKEYYGLA